MGQAALGAAPSGPEPLGLVLTPPFIHSLIHPFIGQMFIERLLCERHHWIQGRDMAVNKQPGSLPSWTLEEEDEGFTASCTVVVTAMKGADRLSCLSPTPSGRVPGGAHESSTGLHACLPSRGGRTRLQQPLTQPVSSG